MNRRGRSSTTTKDEAEAEEGSGGSKRRPPRERPSAAQRRQQQGGVASGDEQDAAASDEETSSSTGTSSVTASQAMNGQSKPSMRSAHQGDADEKEETSSRTSSLRSESSSHPEATVVSRSRANGASSKRPLNGKPSKSSSSAAAAGTSKRRKRSRVPSAFYVVEHGLSHAPRRRTRPVDDGQTIGEALFFGDDLMFGSLSDGIERLPRPWPENLRQRLYDEAGLRLVMSALPGRTSRWDDEIAAKTMGEFAKPQDFNGLYQFGTLFSSHTPLWVVIALGTNDLKARIRKEALARVKKEEDEFTFRLDLDPHELEQEQEEDEDDSPSSVNAEFIAKSVGSVALKAKRLFKGHCHEGTLRVLVVVPPPVRMTPSCSRSGFDETSVKLSKALGEAFAEMGREFGVEVIQPVTSADKLADGTHHSEQTAKATAEEVWKAIANHLPRKTKRVARPDL